MNFNKPTFGGVSNFTSFNKKQEDGQKHSQSGFPSSGVQFGQNPPKNTTQSIFNNSNYKNNPASTPIFGKQSSFNANNATIKSGFSNNSGSQQAFGGSTFSPHNQQNGLETVDMDDSDTSQSELGQALDSIENPLGSYFQEYPPTHLPGRLGFSFGNGASGIVFNGCSKPINSQEKQKLHHETSAAELGFMRWDTLYNTDTMRKMICESFNIFSSLQAIGKSNASGSLGGLEYVQKIKECSLLYRVMIKAQIQELRKNAKLNQKRRQEEQNNTLKADRIDADELNLIQLTAQEDIWHLCEIFYIDKKKHQYPAPYLVEWIQAHQPMAVDSILKSIEEKQEDFYKDASFWDLIFSLIFQGKTDEVATLLEKLFEEKIEATLDKASIARDQMTSLLEKDDFEMESVSALESNGFHLLQQLIIHRPRLYPSVKMTDFNRLFQEWHSDCELVLEVKGDEIKGVSPELYDVLKLLTGDKNALKERSHAWPEQFVGTLLYSSPMTTWEDLADLAQDCTRDKEPLQHVAYDKLMLQIIKDEPISEILTGCQQLFHPWFVAHLTDLLWHADTEFLGLPLKSEGNIDIREYYLHQYATNLFANSTLYLVILEYLRYCPVNGIHYIDEFMKHIPIDTEVKAEKLFAFIEKMRSSHDLTISSRESSPEEVQRARQGLEMCDHQEILVHQVLAAKHFSQCRYAPAVRHYLQAHDLGKISTLMDQVIEEYLKQPIRSILDSTTQLPSADNHYTVVTLTTNRDDAQSSFQIEGPEQALRVLEDIAVCADSGIEWVKNRRKLRGEAASAFHSCCETVAFVKKFIEMRKLIQSARFAEAAETLVSLVASGSAPHRFRIVLLMQAVGLMNMMEEDQVIFDHKDTFVLMECLESLTLSYRCTEYLRGVSQKDISLIRLALSQNLGNAITYTYTY